MGYIKLKAPIPNPLCIKDIIRTAEMICSSCRSFNSIEKVKGRKVCSNCKDHAKTYTFDSKKVCLIDKKEPSHVVLPATLKEMFGALSADQIGTLEYDLSNPKDFIMDAVPVVPNCVRLSSGLDDTLARLYCSVLRNVDNATATYKDYCRIIGKDSFGSNEESLINRISGKNGTFRKYVLGKRNKYCARAVITPDPNLDVDEICIPASFSDNVKVEREGDRVLLNRQPSLQRMSLMAFRTRLMANSYTIQINPSVYPAFNADFDGDEMNVFCASSYPSKIECETILAVENCILSPQNSMPTIYAIQDAATGAFMMHKLNKVLRKAVVHDCIVVSSIDLSGAVVHTSRDVINALVRAVTNTDDLMDNAFTSSTIRKIVKDITVNSGGGSALMFLGSLQKIVNRWLLEEGLSIGYNDCICDSSPIDMPSTDKDDEDVCIVLNNIRNASQRAVMLLVHKNNPLFTIIESRSKGSLINLGQISSMVGQQWIGRERPLRALPDNRALAWCSPHDNSFHAQGFISSSHSDGLSPVEYFFHCQGGREGLVNTGVNTSDAGYIQRRISKSMQDVTTQYDGIVRDGADIVQFCYGRDNFDNSKI